MKSSAPTSTVFCLSADAWKDQHRAYRYINPPVYSYQRAGQATYLVHADGLPIQPHLVHDARGIFSILLADEFHKAIALVALCNSVLGQVDVHDTPSLQHELPYQAVRYPLVDVADVDGGFLILLPSFLLAYGT